MKIFSVLFIFILFSQVALAFEEVITVPAEDPAGVMLELEEGEYIAEIAGGAISLFYPINPNYSWVVGVAIGKEAKGGQDIPDIGTLYFEPRPAAHNQAEAEQLALEATEQNSTGTYLQFSLNKSKTVRFWVSDFDYSDNNGMVKVKIYSIEP